MRLLFVILFLLITTEANATRYWADTTGNNAATCSNIDGSADPGSYGTITRAAVCATANGDEVYIKPGTYTTNLTVTNPVDGVTIRGSDSTYANWPLLRPTTGADVFLFNSVDRTIGVTFQYIKVDHLNNSSGARTCWRTSGGTNVKWTLTDFECKGPSGATASDTAAGIEPSQSSQNVYIARGYIGRWHSADGDPGAHCFYVRGINITIENTFCENTNGLGIQIYCGSCSPSSVTYRYNHVYNVAKRGIFCGTGTGHRCYNNIVRHVTGSGGIRATGTSPFIVNNTVYDVAEEGILIATSSAEVRNNIVRSSGGTAVDNTVGAAAVSNNTTADPSFMDAANGNFSLNTGSVAIDAGVVIAGFSTGRYVGAGVDTGALESCIRNKSVVENDEPTHYHTAYDCPIQSARNNVTLQTPTVGNWAMVVAGVSKTLGNGGLVSATISGQTTVETVLASAVTNGQSLTDAMTRSAAPTLMDNVCIGDPNSTCLNAHVRSHTAASGTNNVGAAPSHVVVQSRYRFHKLRGTEASPVVQCATCTENVSITLPPGAAFRLRVKFRSDDNVGSVYNLRYSKDGGAYTLTPDAFGADFISWYGITADTDIPAAGTPTTELLTSDEANVACAVVRTSSDYPNIALNNSETECEYVLKISTAAPVGTTYDFRVYDGSGSAIDTYTNTPRLTVGSYTMMEG